MPADLETRPGSVRDSALRTTDRSCNWRRKARIILASLGVCAAFATIGWVFRAPLLTGLAKAWIVDQPVKKADAIVVLGGNLERIIEAARLHREGFAPKILIMEGKPNPAVELGGIVPDVEITRRILTKKGVPPEAVLVVGRFVTSTRDEALAIRDWARTNGTARLIIPTDVFHTRRVNWLFQKVLEDTTAEVCVTAVLPREYRTSDWWRHEEGLIAFQNEVIKYIYYRFKY